VENNSDQRDLRIHSVDRAVSVLQVLARRGPTTITEMGAELNIHKSTVFRLMSTLEARGMVAQYVSRGRYELGHGVVQLAAGASRKLDLPTISRPICEALAADVGETVDIAIHDNKTVLSITQVIGGSAISAVNWVGQRTPIHATSSGKVFLADMPPEERGHYLSETLERFTPKTITSHRKLEEQLDEVLEQGYGYTIDELEIGLSAIAAPIRDIHLRAIAAVSVSGPTFRLNINAIRGVADRVIAAAAEISQRSGEPKPG
jgi:IclR family acetate operon transcriptional repressor